MLSRYKQTLMRNVSQKEKGLEFRHGDVHQTDKLTCMTCLAKVVTYALIEINQLIRFVQLHTNADIMLIGLFCNRSMLTDFFYFINKHLRKTFKQLKYGIKLPKVICFVVSSCQNLLLFTVTAISVQSWRLCLFGLLLCR
jgi:CDP-diglyceride synthetase